MKAATQRGSILLLVLITLIVFALIATAIIGYLNRQTNAVIRTTQVKQAFHAADAGVHYTQWLLNEGGATPDSLASDPPPITAEYPIRDSGDNPIAYFALTFSNPAADQITVRAQGYDASLTTTCQTVNAVIIKPEGASNFLIGSWQFLPGTDCDKDVPAPSPIINPGPSPGSPAHLIFVTSTAASADIGGVGGADQYCQQLAGNAGLTTEWGNFRAVLSTSTTFASDRLTITGPIVNRRSEVIANSAADLWDGQIARKINVDETNAELPPTNVWTGTRTNGTSYSNDSASMCYNWTSAQTGIFTAVGNTDSTNAAWIDLEANACSNLTHHLYCLSGQDAPIVNTHTIFASNATVLPDGLEGLTGADLLCRSQAADAGIPNPDTYKAILSNSTTNARDRLTITKPIINRVGELVATNAADFWDGTLNVPVAYNQYGDFIDADTTTPWVWTGTDAAGGANAAGGAAWCADWGTSGPVGNNTAFRGHLHSTSNSWVADSAAACTGIFRIYCIGDQPLDPEPDQEYTLFSTSTTTTGNLGGLDGADALCQQRAQAASLDNPTSYKAVLSDSSIDARDRITVSGPVKNTSDFPLANDATDLWDGAIAELVHNESGSVNFNIVWTGTQTNGEYAGLSCGSWQNSTGFTYYGRAAEGDFRWINAGQTECNLQRSLYCISDQPAALDLYIAGSRADSNDIDKSVTLSGDTTDANLVWASTSVTDCTTSATPANGSWTGSIANHGTAAVPLPGPGTYTFTISCTNIATGNTMQDQVTATVPPPSLDLYVNANQADSNDIDKTVIIAATATSVDLVWNSVSVSDCTATATPANGSWTGSLNTSGSSTVPLPGPGTYTFNISCTNTLTNDPIQDHVNVTVPIPALDIYVTGAQADSNDADKTVALPEETTSFGLTWDSVGVNSCAANAQPPNDNWSGSISSNGSITITANPGSFTFSISCQKDTGGTINDAVTVTIPAPSNHRHIIFAKQGARYGNLGGVSGADTLCQQEASDAGIPGTYKAILSASTGTARSRFTLSAPILLTNDNKIADNESDLWDGTIDLQISRTAYNTFPQRSLIWSGSTASGAFNQLPSGTTHCDDWTSSSAGSVRTGSRSYTDSRWLNNTDESCGVTGTFYCLSEAPVPPLTPKVDLYANNDKTDSNDADKTITMPAGTTSVYLVWENHSVTNCIASASPENANWSGYVGGGNNKSVAIAGPGTHTFTLSCTATTDFSTVQDYVSVIIP